MEPHDASRRATSREQVSRIDRGYYRRASPLRSRRTWLILVAAAAAAGWCTWAAVDAPRHLAPGPVVAAHARWERDCQACHVPFTPIKDDTWLSTDRTRAAMDAKCAACHRVAAHHPLMVATEEGSCASCHSDHMGRQADVSRVADRTCAQCHADIASHRLATGGTAAPPSSVTTPITRFDAEHHPPFASLAADPGRLKFSHGRHMTAGLVFAAPTKDGPLTYAKLAPADRDRLMPPGAATDDPVQLSCASCHEFAATQTTGEVRSLSAALTAAPPGAYALPVTFERHCAACHELPYDPAVAGKTIPHGLDAEATRRFLVAEVLEASAAGQAALDAEPRPAALPANTPPPTPPIETLRDVLRERVDTARAFTRGTCGKCHEVADVELPAAPLLHAADAAAGPETWFRVPPAGVPDVWLTKARFSHVPHRGFDCRACHAAAYPPDGGAGAAASGGATSPLDNATVMIAGRDSCVACHAPPGTDVDGRPTGGVRFDCVECHGYHGLGPHRGVPAHELVPGTIETGLRARSR